MADKKETVAVQKEEYVTTGKFKASDLYKQEDWLYCDCHCCNRRIDRSI